MTRPSRQSKFLRATSVKNGGVTKTTAFQRRSDDANDNNPTNQNDTYIHHPQSSSSSSSSSSELDAAIRFHQRLFALLVLQYTTILVIASPFALLSTVQEFLESHSSVHTTLEIIAIGGIIMTMTTAILCGSTYPYAHICLVAITLFVGLEMGLSFASTPTMYIAIGQAVTSFALLLALMQFQFDWLDYPMAVMICLVAAAFWTLILMETNNFTLISSLSICGGGFAFVCLVLFASYHVEHFVGPDEYVLGTLFILCPEALLCIPGSSKRNVTDESVDGTGEGEMLLKEEDKEQG